MNARACGANSVLRVGGVCGVLQACCDVTKEFTASSWDPKNVTDALVHATTGSNPRHQYLVGADAKFKLTLLIMLPLRVYEPLVQALHLSKLVPAARKNHKVAKAGKEL